MTQQTIGPSPAAYGNGVMGYDPIRMEVLYYGSSETWTWNGTWTLKSPVTTPSYPFYDGLAYSSTFDEMVMFGPQGTYTWNGTDWQLRSTTMAPVEREGGAMSYAGPGGTILYGGNDQLFPQTFYAETWGWLGSDWAIVPGNPTTPPARQGHAMAYDARHGETGDHDGVRQPRRAPRRLRRLRFSRRQRRYVGAGVHNTARDTRGLHRRDARRRRRWSHRLRGSRLLGTVQPVVPASDDVSRERAALWRRRLRSGREQRDLSGRLSLDRGITKRVAIEVSAETHALWRRTRTALDEEYGKHLSDDDFVQILCRRATQTPAATDDVPRPTVQTAVTTCKACKQSFVEGAGETLPIDEATAAQLTCDAEHIGDLESDELSRVTTTIPSAIRRKVFHRDLAARA